MNEERIDVLSRWLEPLGITKTKREVHRDGDWHRAAHLWVVTPDRRVVLQQRALSKENHPGLWDVSTAGHLSAGESAVEAIIREAFEELGLDVVPHDLQLLGTCREQFVLNDGKYIDNEVHEVFVVEREVAELPFGRDEVMDVALVPIDELRQRVAADDPTLVPHPCEYDLLFAHMLR